MKDAVHRGVITTRGTIDDVKAFADVVALTENRKGVALRNEDYFRKMMEIYGDDAYYTWQRLTYQNVWLNTKNN
mgnify:CR=1 FL=1